MYLLGLGLGLYKEYRCIYTDIKFTDINVTDELNRHRTLE